MEVIQSVDDLLAWRRERAEALDLGFVPTMGALHEGHFSLVREAKTRHERVAVSIYVNPLQFGPHEDYLKYPRNLEADVEGLLACGCDLVFAPSPSDLQHSADPLKVASPKLGHELCGAFRPGHFDGVLTIVLRLFRLMQPRAAFFGLKDRQQFTLIRRMAEEWFLNVDVVGLPTVREADGLAMSSRNVYLSPEERSRAVQIPAVLKELADQARAWPTASRVLETKGRAALEAAGFRVDYLECRHADDLRRSDLAAIGTVFLVAAWLGATRLIDNLVVE